MDKRKGGQRVDGEWLVLTEVVGFKHHCGAEIMTARRAHPIWDGPFPMSGRGRCHYEMVPYCPNCEEEPDFHGAPILVPFTFPNVIAVSSARPPVITKEELERIQTYVKKGVPHNLNQEERDDLIFLLDKYQVDEELGTDEQQKNQHRGNS